MTGASAKAARDFDPLRTMVFHHLFAAVAEEMGVALLRSAFSANIKERRDFSCAVFAGSGELIAQAAHVPVHLGATPLSVEAVRGALDLGPGDIALHNDPFTGGTHLPDVTLVAPVFASEAAAHPSFFVVSRAHHADIGGAFPGSMAPMDDVHGEGLRLPPVRIQRAGEIDRDLLAVFLANVRVPDERRADLLAQVASARVGAARLQAMMAEHGAAELEARGQGLVRWTAARAAELIDGIPLGRWTAEGVLEGGRDGLGELVPIRLTLTRDGEGLLTFDFEGSADQALDGSPVNTTRAVTVSAVLYGLRCLLPPGTPTNIGVLDRVRVRTRPGSVCAAAYPAPVAAGNVETSQRLVDVVLEALGGALPGRVPAMSAGTMSNLVFGGTDATGTAFTHYETHGGGAGAGPTLPGAHGVQTHMTNTRNTPVEAIEIEMPVRVECQTLRRQSGGAGARPGGDGIVRRLRFLRDVRVSWMAERQRIAPGGAEGGADGATGKAFIRRPGDDEGARTSPKATLQLPAGSTFELRTPGGGGHGS